MDQNTKQTLQTLLLMSNIKVADWPYLRKEFSAVKNANVGDLVSAIKDGLETGQLLDLEFWSGTGTGKRTGKRTRNRGRRNQNSEFVIAGALLSTCTQLLDYQAQSVLDSLSTELTKADQQPSDFVEHVMEKAASKEFRILKINEEAEQQEDSNNESLTRAAMESSVRPRLWDHVELESRGRSSRRGFIVFDPLQLVQSVIELEEVRGEAQQPQPQQESLPVPAGDPPLSTTQLPPLLDAHLPPAAEPTESTDVQLSPAAEPTEATDVQLPPAAEPTEATDVQLPPAAEPTGSTDVQLPPAAEPTESTDVQLPPAAEPTESTDVQLPPAAEPTESTDVQLPPVTEHPHPEARQSPEPQQERSAEAAAAAAAAAAAEPEADVHPRDILCTGDEAWDKEMRLVASVIRDALAMEAELERADPAEAQVPPEMPRWRPPRRRDASPAEEQGGSGSGTEDEENRRGRRDSPVRKPPQSALRVTIDLEQGLEAGPPFALRGQHQGSDMVAPLNVSWARLQEEVDEAAVRPLLRPRPQPPRGADGHAPVVPPVVTRDHLRVRPQWMQGAIETANVSVEAIRNNWSDYKKDFESRLRLKSTLKSLSNQAQLSLLASHLGVASSFSHHRKPNDASSLLMPGTSTPLQADEKIQQMLSILFAQPVPLQAVPTDELPAEPQPVPTDELQAEPQPVPTDELQAVPQPVPTDELQAEPQPVPTDELQAEPQPVPTDEPQPVPTEELQAEPQPVPTDEPQPVPMDELPAEPQPVPTDEPQPEPTDELQPVPMDEPQPVPTDQPQTAPTAQPQPMPRGEPQATPSRQQSSHRRPIITENSVMRAVEVLWARKEDVTFEDISPPDKTSRTTAEAVFRVLNGMRRRKLILQQPGGVDGLLYIRKLPSV